MKNILVPCSDGNKRDMCLFKVERWLHYVPHSHVVVGFPWNSLSRDKYNFPELAVWQPVDDETESRFLMYIPSTAIFVTVPTNLCKIDHLTNYLDHTIYLLLEITSKLMSEINRWCKFYNLLSLCFPHEIPLLNKFKLSLLLRFEKINLL